MLSAPTMSDPMYWVLVPFFLFGCGPFGFANDVRPLPFATSNCRPSGVTRTEVGYQPTGMNPSEWLRPIEVTSKTATSLLHALATNSFVSSGDSARLLGVLPGGASGESAARSVSTVLPNAVSITVTVF